MVSASGINRYCGYAVVLRKRRIPSKKSMVAMALGNVYHALSAGVPPVDKITDSEMTLVKGWLENYERDPLRPPANAQKEVAIGIDPKGNYVEVIEPEPHVYVAKNGEPLLTAGRADAAWTEAARGHVLDHKSGQYKADPSAANMQLTPLGFGWASLHGSESISLSLRYARNGEWDTAEIDLGSSYAADLWGELVRAVAISNDPTPRPGRHCRTCWERGICEWKKSNKKQGSKND